MIMHRAGRRDSPEAPREACSGCRFFMYEPRALERALPGLASLSSAYASVRAGDGLCLQHDRYVAASSSCERHSPA